MADIVTLHMTAPEGKSGFCLTPTATAIMSTLNICHTLGKMGSVTGGPGVGKSSAIAEFARQQPHAILCRMTKAAGRLQPGLARIVTSLGGYAAAQMGSADLYEEILRRLPHYTTTLLILDEAQHMDDDLLEAVRDLFDEDRGGVVLVGSGELSDRWNAKSAAKRRKWAQLTSRLTVNYDIPAALPEDIAALCDHHAIASKRSRALLSRAGASDGGLRNIAVRIAIARNLVGAGAIELAHLEEAERILGTR
ncbi:MAG: ATP-binding protein [Alphaproteobacteria bacterium]|nr:ATP-binding protein [Alphaproteobacteria bacterium]